MRRRRMHRDFRPEPPDRATLDRLIYAAGRAQVARPGIRHLIVITDPRIVHTLRQACPGFVNNAPAAIAVCSDLHRSEEESGVRGVEIVSRLDAGAHPPRSWPSPRRRSASASARSPAGARKWSRPSWASPNMCVPEVLMAVGSTGYEPLEAAEGLSTRRSTRTGSANHGRHQP